MADRQDPAEFQANLQAPALTPEVPHVPTGPRAMGLGELAAKRLFPLAVQAYEDLLVNAKSEKVRLEAANAVTELAGARQHGPSSVGITFNMPPEYLAKTFRAMGKLAREEDVIDVTPEPG